MADVTALELVNTVLNFHRFPEVTDFSKTEAKVALKVINMGVDKILNSNDWDFARRHDGVLVDLSPACWIRTCCFKSAIKGSTREAFQTTETMIVVSRVMMLAYVSRSG